MAASTRSRPPAFGRLALAWRRVAHPVESARILAPSVLPVWLRARLTAAFSAWRRPLRVPEQEAEVAALVASWEAAARALAPAPARALPLVSIVVVTFGNRALTRLCLESVRCFTGDVEHEIVAVDNGSPDGTPALLRELAATRPTLRVIENGENRGFAAATNQGVSATRGRLLCLLNNDTVVTPGWLAALAGTALDDPALGLVGPVTNAAGNEARVRRGYRDLGELPSWAAGRAARCAGQSFPIPMLALYCAVLRRDVWERVGPLDEQFGAGMFEDDDYSRRVRAAGYTLRCRRDVFVHHWQRAGFKLLGEEAYRRLYEANRARFRAKWG
ncbi:MAG TPA: glycosyltransferase family 2 protein [Thermoanaerobaculaceae bacterium]|nr:glycosyltransferase family 2 protein [Thermoanaerobaculaceae bacterium]HRS15486.1 glycosyltransferase family 2 protein [Thermoanaerobaculaceae bacterium]